MGLPGGIASKLGENFENDCVINNIIDVLKGDYKSLTREKIDIPFNNGLDYELVDNMNVTYVVQVKKVMGKKVGVFLILITKKYGKPQQKHIKIIKNIDLSQKYFFQN